MALEKMGVNEIFMQTLLSGLNPRFLHESCVKLLKAFEGEVYLNLIFHAFLRVYVRHVLSIYI